MEFNVLPYVNCEASKAFVRGGFVFADRRRERTKPVKTGHRHLRARDAAAANRGPISGSFASIVHQSAFVVATSYSRFHLLGAFTAAGGLAGSGLRAQSIVSNRLL
jgi:hypothetical protein